MSNIGVAKEKTDRSEPCKNCGAKKNKGVMTCSYCGRTQWGIILFAIFFGSGALALGIRIGSSGGKIGALVFGGVGVVFLLVGISWITEALKQRKPRISEIVLFGVIWLLTGGRIGVVSGSAFLGLLLGALYALVILLLVIWIKETLRQRRSSTGVSMTRDSGATQSELSSNTKFPKAVVSRSPLGKFDPECNTPGSIWVSPDNRRVASYAVSGKKSAMLIDGKKSKRYDGLGVLAFSPDSTRVAFGAKRGNETFYVLDEKEGNPYDSVGFPVFSPDSKQLVYLAQSGTRLFIVVDGQEGKPSDEVGPPVISPDGTCLAHGFAHDGKYYMSMGDREWGPYDAVGTPVFSPDGGHLAYAASKGNSWFLVLDGENEEEHKGLPMGSGIMSGVAFSPDGRLLAYPFKSGRDHFIIVDGKRRKRYDAVQGPVSFSPDSKRIAYGASLNNKWFVVVDGEEGKEYLGIVENSLVFSPDSKHVLYGAGFHSGGAVVCSIVVDGVEGEVHHDAIMAQGGGIGFDSDIDFNYVVQAGNGLFRIEERMDLAEIRK